MTIWIMVLDENPAIVPYREVLSSLAFISQSSERAPTLVSPLSSGVEVHLLLLLCFAVASALSLLDKYDSTFFTEANMS